MRIVRNQVEYPETSAPLLDEKTVRFAIECGDLMQEEATQLLDSLGSLHA